MLQTASNVVLVVTGISFLITILVGFVLVGAMTYRILTILKPRSVESQIERVDWVRLWVRGTVNYMPVEDRNARLIVQLYLVVRWLMLVNVVFFSILMGIGILQG